ncbi:MAG TPA: alpha/beta fold hydrolase [Candidatus Baltobacteraceae bacterium]|jgi:pimeloyl-ACP methyl ester carboxylesterase|nr:alpha/beta fold hydrolase [Candidatus Baltobacteraceae bacterium]
MRIDLLRVHAQHNPVAVLAYQARRPRNVRVVAGHGYSSSKHNLDFLCNFLASHGYGVFSLDFPGHKLGASGGFLGSLDDLPDAMGAVVELVRSLDDGPIYCMGHSMGAMTALFVAASDPQIAGTIAITTGFGRPSALEALQSKGVTDFRSAYVDGLALPQLMQGADERFAQALPRLAGRPQLYIAAARDAMVTPRSVEDLFDRAPEPKTFVTIDSDHTYAGENARSAVLQWLNERHPRS